MWSRSLLVQNLLVPKKAKPPDSDADSADAVAERSISEMRSSPSGSFEQGLVNAVLSGEAGAAGKFLEHVSTPLWSVVVKLAGNGADGEAAFLHIVAALKADDYARLRGFDGRSRLATYLSLVARDVLADQLAGQFSSRPHEAWERFSRYFETDIRSRIGRQMPSKLGRAGREDAYQEVCLKLIENDFRRIRSYDGRGSFTGYILTVVDRILIDLVRREAPRRRMPAAVARSAPLDQAIYAAVVWQGCPPDADRLAAVLRGRLEHDPAAADIAESVARVAGIARLERASPATEPVSLETLLGEGGGLSVADSSPTPEDHLLLFEEEQRRAALVAAVNAAAEKLPTDERLYLQIVFSAIEPLPARGIARLMGCPVEEVYRLKQRTQRWLKEITVQLEKNANMSV
ncbi:sigma-70 family RNA polymerase sigma factor [Bradyrhizobium sp. BWA-3-5]|uniref:sigma-70 family RNA polymerase sigma factor n=1 Tax=Bradyrhizobium sp. BWA-3-5 TaxID=3080013 RepID=UPI00293EB825|nr:sigma-70 family RNA polymerase sigma factor [Bradyrhizobium sp. BWA-3-5]WOH68574.1 sigma-70 family RNA polymerase sigma factor [Bradyrhizobium sp. BWA-3-5]